MADTFERHKIRTGGLVPGSFEPGAFAEVTIMNAAIIVDGKEAMGPQLFDQPLGGGFGFEFMLAIEPAEVESFRRITPLDGAVFVLSEVWVIGHVKRRGS